MPAPKDKSKTKGKRVQQGPPKKKRESTRRDPVEVVMEMDPTLTVAQAREKLGLKPPPLRSLQGVKVDPVIYDKLVARANATANGDIGQLVTDFLQQAERDDEASEPEAKTA